jgi:anti-sigma factor RsiW
MSAGRQTHGSGCDGAFELLHLRLDGVKLEVEQERRLQSHLSACPACGEAAAQLGRLQDGLRDLPHVPLPDSALEEVWRRTSRRPPFGGWLGEWMLDWRAAAVAAALCLALVAVWQLGQPLGLVDRPPIAEDLGAGEPSEEELARAAAEARLVLQMTAQALRATQRTAVDEVLAGQVSPALRSTTIRWPGSAARQSGGSRGKGNDDV